MAGKLPIDRVREKREAPRVLEDERRRYAEQEARLRQTDLPEEGERPPDPGRATPPGTERPDGGRSEGS